MSQKPNTIQLSLASSISAEYERARERGLVSKEWKDLSDEQRYKIARAYEKAVGRWNCSLPDYIW